VGLLSGGGGRGSDARAAVISLDWEIASRVVLVLLIMARVFWRVVHGE
jgi:hypothetical protein